MKMPKISPQLKKILTILGYVLMFLSFAGLFYWLYKKFILPLLQTKDTSDDITTASTDSKDLESKGLKATYPLSWYSDQAEQWEKAFSLTRFTDVSYNEIMQFLMRLKNYVDFLKLKDAFGLRGVDMFGLVKGGLTDAVVKHGKQEALAAYNGYIRGLYDNYKKKFK